jgi:hypothetical protein
MYTSPVGVHLGKLPVLQRKLLSRRYNIITWISVSNARARQRLVITDPKILVEGKFDVSPHLLTEVGNMVTMKVGSITMVYAHLRLFCFTFAVVTRILGNCVVCGVHAKNIFFYNPILFAVCTSTFSKLCKQHIQQHVEECSVALLCK